MVYGYVLRLTDFVILLYRGEQRRMLYQFYKIGQNNSNSFIGAISFGGCSYGDILCCSSKIEVIRRVFCSCCCVLFHLVVVVE